MDLSKHSSTPPEKRFTQHPHHKDSNALTSLFAGSWGETALKLWVSINPSVQWANKQIEPFKGLPFGPYLHHSRPRRYRTLTAPLDLSEDTFWHRFQVFSNVEAPQHTYEQVQSSLFAKLSLDIRMLIYDMVLGGMTFHLSAGNQSSRILHYICKAPDRLEEQVHSDCYEYSAHRPPSTASAASESSRSEVATGLLPLLVSCRRAYSEAINILYSANVFEFTQNFAAFRFLKVEIAPSRLSSIRHFRLYMRIPRHPDANNNSHRDWNDLWVFFSKQMTGLQSLHLRLAMLEPMERRIRETMDDAGSDWIEPMILMAFEADRKRGCNVEIHTGQDNTVHDLGRIFKEIEHENPTLGFEAVLGVVCATVHRRIRLSLGGQG